MRKTPNALNTREKGSKGKRDSRGKVKGGKEWREIQMELKVAE